MTKYQKSAMVYLLSASGFVSYSQVGAVLGIQGRPTGQVISALGKRGYLDLCAKVVSKKKLRQIEKNKKISLRLSSVG
jgi:hypothetical protein